MWILSLWFRGKAFGQSSLRPNAKKFSRDGCV